jgi:hypothetical protein
MISNDKLSTVSRMRRVGGSWRKMGSQAIMSQPSLGAPVLEQEPGKS